RWLAKVAPSSAVISPLLKRDITPDGRQSFQLVLEYTFKQAEVGEVS
ncbi:unnamed protein product, partial [Discosporangium mesarthrocarpum]